jgi:hypothetical protein
MAGSGGGCHWAAKPDRLQSVCSSHPASRRERQHFPKAAVPRELAHDEFMTLSISSSQTSGADHR